ncbi:hypothetical protein NDU88_005870 [Pleurodeles waltl]|uniref:Uncharacterized protein n=1 Tax=Pleurodeles waltl TaxID=8319 RepID=A0AAV7SMW1_PLEWA|nr:hypothetical protein NDU88_005870 [Pleurodeles waltl]
MPASHACYLKTTTDLILKEITVVGHRLEVMEEKTLDLIVEMKSIWADITGFHDKVEALDHCLSILEARIDLIPDRGLELRVLQDKIINPEDRSCRDNICFFGIPEKVEGG